MSARTIIPNNTPIPYDILSHITSFLPWEKISPIFQTCKIFAQWAPTIVKNHAIAEHLLMQIPFKRVKLSEDRIIEEWSKLAPESFSNLVISLNKQSLVFYSQHSAVTILLKPDVVGARGDSEKLAAIVKEERDSKKAVIIAKSIPDDQVRFKALSEIASRETIGWREALGIADQIGDQGYKNKALLNISVRRDIPYKEALSIAEKISDAGLRNMSLMNLITGRDELSYEEKSLIAKKISNPKSVCAKIAYNSLAIQKKAEDREDCNVM